MLLALIVLLCICYIVTYDEDVIKEMKKNNNSFPYYFVKIVMYMTYIAIIAYLVIMFIHNK